MRNISLPLIFNKSYAQDGKHRAKGLNNKWEEKGSKVGSNHIPTYDYYFLKNVPLVAIFGLKNE